MHASIRMCSVVLLMSPKLMGKSLLKYLSMRSYLSMSSVEGATKQKMGRACEGSRQELLKCLKESECVKVRPSIHYEAPELKNLRLPIRSASNAKTGH